MDHDIDEIVRLLEQMEAELRRLGLWEEEAPADEDLASPLPFAHDRLEFHQWLQWILLPRMRQLCRDASPLPTASAIAPMAEVQLAPWGSDAGPLLSLLRELDHQLDPSA
jgi:uncharacterized protein YqcC (DUF446 family)